MYWPDATNDWTEPVSPLDREYFRVNQVVYPPDTNMTEDITGHLITIETPNGSGIGSTVIKFSTTAGHGGTAQYNEFLPDKIDEWSWSEDKPYEKKLYVLTDFPDAYTVFLYYYTPTNGRCVSYYNGGSGWQQLQTGTGTFTDTDLH